MIIPRMLWMFTLIWLLVVLIFHARFSYIISYTVYLWHLRRRVESRYIGTSLLFMDIWLYFPPTVNMYYSITLKLNVHKERSKHNWNIDEQNRKVYKLHWMLKRKDIQTLFCLALYSSLLTDIFGRTNRIKEWTGAATRVTWSN